MNTEPKEMNNGMFEGQMRGIGIYPFPISDAQIKKLWRATQRAYGIKAPWYKRLWWWLLDKLE